MDSDDSFFKPRQLLATALGISVGISWNNAVRELVDDYVKTDTGEGAFYTALMVTVIVVLIYFATNWTHRTAVGLFGETKAPSGGSMAGGSTAALPGDSPPM